MSFLCINGGSHLQCTTIVDSSSLCCTAQLTLDDLVDFLCAVSAAGGFTRLGSNSPVIYVA